MFSNFYWLDPHNETCVGLANLLYSINKNRTSPYLVEVIGNACLLILSWIIEVLPIVLTIEYGVVDKIWRCRPIAMAFVLWLSPSHTTIKCRCSMKKTNQITPAYLCRHSIPTSLLLLLTWAKTSSSRTSEVPVTKPTSPTDPRITLWEASSAASSSIITLSSKEIHESRIASNLAIMRFIPSSARSM